MRNYLLHEDLKKLADHVYKGEKNNSLTNWKFIDKHETKNDFRAIAYEQGNNIVISFAGTDISQFKDRLNDYQMGFGFMPSQIKEAEKFYNQVKQNYPNTKIIFTGHSLGGSLAQLMSAKTNNDAVTFNAYGTGDILLNSGYTKQKDLKIINYGNINDPIFGMKYNRQPGKVFITNTNLNPDNKYGISKGISPYTLAINSHFLNRMNNLRNAVEVEPSNYQNQNKTPVLKARIEENVLLGGIDNDFTKEQISGMDSRTLEQNWDKIINQMNTTGIPSEKDFDRQDLSKYSNPELDGSNKIFTREEILKMSSDEFAKNEKAIFHQSKTIGIPTGSEVKKAGLRFGSANGHWVTID